MATEAKHPTVVSGGGTDQNDVALTVPAGKEWVLRSVLAELTTTATVGERQLRIQVRDDADNVVHEEAASATVSESTGPVTLSAGEGVPRAAQIAADLLSVPLPPILLAPGWDVRVFDSTNVDTADDLTVRGAVEEGLS